MGEILKNEERSFHQRFPSTHLTSLNRISIKKKKKGKKSLMLLLFASLRWRWSYSQKNGPYLCVFRLEVKLDSQPEAEVKWFVNEVQVMPTQRTQVLKDGSTHVLVIIDVTPEDSGEYVCQAENIYGTVTCKTTLIVTRKFIGV